MGSSSSFKKFFIDLPFQKNFFLVWKRYYLNFQYKNILNDVNIWGEDGGKDLRLLFQISSSKP